MSGFVILVVGGGAGPASSGMAESMAKRLPDGFTIKVPPASDEETLCASVGDVDAILSVKVTRRMILSAPKLRMIQVPGTGVDKVDLDTAIGRGIIVCNSVGESAVAVSEHAIALMLALAKNLHKSQKNFASGRWVKERTILLEGNTLGIIGLGSTGTAVAKRVTPFGMRVLALKRHPDDALKGKLGLAFLGGPESLGYILGESDFVLLSTVLTDETKGMIGRKQIAEMKAGAYLINVARAEVVDGNALVEALRSGRLAGAGIDVFDVEPIEPSNPLLQLDNVILTPHVGGTSLPPSANLERVDFLVGNIVKGVTGGVPENRVDPILRYARRTTPVEL